jgi:membrane associated rhomboid family serine protease
MRDVIPSPPVPAEQKPRPVAWVTWSLIGSCVAMFLLQLIWLHHGDDTLGDALAFSSQALAEHRYWTLLTYAWVHAVSIFGYPWLFWLHVTFNMLALAWFGPAVEELLGPWRYLGLYVGGAIMAALTWYCFTPSSLTEQGIIGASGAVFAVVAALGTLAPTDWELVIYPFAVPLGHRIRLAVFLMCAVEALPIFFNWMPEVAHTAHLGGAAFGFVYVLLCRRYLHDSFLSPE